MTIGVAVFPGSNCDRDVRWAVEGCLGIPTRFLWHEERDLVGYYGDKYIDYRKRVGMLVPGIGKRG